MKTLNAFAIAAFVAASASTAAFADDSDAASQTPFVYSEGGADTTVSTEAVPGTNEYAVEQANRAGYDQDDAAAETPFVYEASDEESDEVTRGDNNLAVGTDAVRGTNEYSMTHEGGHNMDQNDAASQTPFVYTE